MTFTLEQKLMDYPITACITLLNEDIHVLLTGGSLPHTGAVAMYQAGEEDGTIQPAEHRDLVLAKLWAESLSCWFLCRVTVVCGIHYDGIGSTEIARIVSVCSDLLQQAIRSIQIIKQEKENEQS